MSTNTFSVWWIDKVEGVVSYRGFVTRRECGGICTLYLSRVKKLSPSTYYDFVMQEGCLKIVIPNHAPWVDHPDVILEGLEHVAHRDVSASYYRVADETMIWVEPVSDG